MKRAGNALLGGALWIGAIIGTVSLIAMIAVPVLGVRPLIFRSGSMAPTIPTGSLGFAERESVGAVAIGDIVTVPYNGSYVTHRVVKVEPHGDGAVLTLKGDANSVTDQVGYRVTYVDRTVGHVPYAGYVIAWFSHAPGVFVLAGYLALVLMSLRRRPTRHDRNDDTGGPKRPRRMLRVSPVKAPVLPGRLVDVVMRAATVIVVAAVGALAWGVARADAAWGDAVPTSGTALGTVTPSAPTASCGTSAVNSQTLTWNAVSKATGYVINYGSGGSSSADVGNTTSYTFSGGAFGTFTVKAYFGSATWISAASNSRSYTTAIFGTCS